MKTIKIFYILYNSTRGGPPLPERQTQGSQGRGAGGQKPGRCTSPDIQSPERKAIPQVPRTLGRRRVVEDGTDEEEARAARLDGWIVWEAEEMAEERATQGACGRWHLFLFFSFLLIPRALHTVHRRGWKISYVVSRGRSRDWFPLSSPCPHIP